MKKNYLLLLIGALVLLGGSAKSQQWYFGNNAGIDFSGPLASVNGGQTNHQECTGVQFDCSGNLLFYTDGISVWDENHSLFSGGPLNGSTSLTQALIAPKPGSGGNEYFIFYGSAATGITGAEIRYAVVDMSTKTITVKDQALPTVGGAIFFEGMTLVAHSNGVDYWLLTHRGNSARFDIYLIDGVSGTDGIAWNRQESIGSAIPGYTSSNAGYMATSKNNDRIAYACARTGDLHVFSFNNGNGDITGILQTWSFGDFEWVYGVDFSPNGLYVYMTKRAGANVGIYKGRISDGAMAQIYAPAFAAGAVRRGPDDKLYFVELGLQQVGVINDPDNYGAPNLNANAVNIAPNTVQDGLPTLPIDYCSGTPCLNSYRTDVVSSCVPYTWIDGLIYTSSNNTATHTITNVAGCDSVVSLDLTINTVNSNVTTSGMSISADATGASYQWLDCNTGYSVMGGETNQNYTASIDGSYAVEVSENGCSDTSSCTVVSTVGLDEIASFSGLGIFPNPSSGEVNMRFAGLKNPSVAIYSLEGRLVYRQENIDQNEIRLELNQAPGLYFIEVSTENHKKRFKLRMN